MQITKEQFIKAMTDIQEQMERDQKFPEVLEPFFDDFQGIYITPLVQDMTDLLKELTGDELEDSFIEYYIYELDWGQKEMAKDCISHADGSKHSLTNLLELYQYLEGRGWNENNKITI